MCFSAWRRLLGGRKSPPEHVTAEPDIPLGQGDPDDVNPWVQELVDQVQPHEVRQTSTYERTRTQLRKERAAAQRWFDEGLTVGDGTVYSDPTE